MNCHYCEHRCDLTAGKSVCGMYHEQDGQILETYPNQWSTYSASRVESVPFYHAYPGSRSMIIGSAGCNFRCRYCSNAFIACQDPARVQKDLYHFTPENLVAMAQKLGCHNIVFNVNEPTVSLPSLEQVHKAAQKAGLPMGCLTNGYTTPEATQILARIFSFVHVGLKGFSDRFYQKYVGVPSISPVLRNIDILSRTCHMEIASPVIQDVNDHELLDIARFIRDINPEIPWHVFRLLPEHRMKAARYPDIGLISQTLEKARAFLPYVYFHNFVGSDWVNTLCPSCGKTVVRRFSLGCSGDRLDEFLAPDNQCPACGRGIAMLGTRVPWNKNQWTGWTGAGPEDLRFTVPAGPAPGELETGLAIIDAREWQNRFDLATGAKTNRPHSLAPMLSDVLAQHPYPGDVDLAANQWVTDTALDLVKSYDPSLVCLSYVQQFFAVRHFDHGPDASQALFSAAVEEACRFIDRSGFTPVFVGTGPLIPLAGTADLSTLSGLAIATNWSCRYCGIHAPTRADMAYLDSLDCLERLVPRAEWVAMFQAAQPDLDVTQDMALMPDFLAVAKEGYAFKTMGSTLRPPVNIPATNFTVPVSTPLGPVADLRDIKPLILRVLARKTRIALILLEGVGREFLPDTVHMAQNGVDWFCNEPGDSFYLTVSTGKHQPYAYPTGYRYFDQNADQIKFPFSGYLTCLPDHTLGRKLNRDTGGQDRSIAVGNRSMFMHTVFGADIGIECFARNLFNQGCLGVIRSPEHLS